MPTATYPDALYEAAATVETLPDLDAIDDEAINRFHREGYLAIERAFSEDRVAEAQAAIDDLVRGRAPGFECVDLEDNEAELSEDERAESVRKLMDFTAFSPTLEAVMNDPELLGTIEKLSGASPVRIQEMALLKPPGGGREKPWHQDLAYFDYPVDTPVVGAWIALDEAVPANGCMHVIAGTHDAPVPHVALRDWQICDSHVLGKPIVAAPLKPGGMLLFSGLLVHGTPENRSTLRRRALQFHYGPATAAKVHPDVRAGVFGERGRDAEC